MSKKQEIESLREDNASLIDENETLKDTVARLKTELAKEKRREYESPPDFEDEILDDIEHATDTVKYQAKTTWSAIKTWRDAKERAGRGETTTEEEE